MPPLTMAAFSLNCLAPWRRRAMSPWRTARTQSCLPTPIPPAAFRIRPSRCLAWPKASCRAGAARTPSCATPTAASCACWAFPWKTPRAALTVRHSIPPSPAPARSCCCAGRAWRKMARLGNHRPIGRPSSPCWASRERQCPASTGPPSPTAASLPELVESALRRPEVAAWLQAHFPQLGIQLEHAAALVAVRSASRHHRTPSPYDGYLGDSPQLREWHRRAIGALVAQPPGTLSRLSLLVLPGTCSGTRAARRARGGCQLRPGRQHLPPHLRAGIPQRPRPYRPGCRAGGTSGGGEIRPRRGAGAGGLSCHGLVGADTCRDRGQRACLACRPGGLRRNPRRIRAAFRPPGPAANR